ncbi:MAG: hypothetical protein J0I12_18575 [Candidatus Eremiobacteraeota bacterium]|nr:hypothetical protein [Candidatus Eremiobacteraeota bacterium]
MLISLLYWLVCQGILAMANGEVDQEHPGQALAYYEMLGQIAPGFPDIDYWQAWRQCELENYAAARSLVEKGRLRNPESPEAPRILGQIAYMEGRFEEALELWKDNPPGQAWAYFELGRLEDCRSALAKCRSDEPGLENLRSALQEQEKAQGR